MTKIKLLGISKNERQSKYTLPKEQKIFGIIRKILIKLEFDELYDDIESFARPADKEGISKKNKEDKITDKRYNEAIFDFANEDYYINIIFFSKKVVLILNYKKDLQQKIAKVLEEFLED